MAHACLALAVCPDSESPAPPLWEWGWCCYDWRSSSMSEKPGSQESLLTEGLWLVGLLTEDLASSLSWASPTRRTAHLIKGQPIIQRNSSYTDKVIMHHVLCEKCLWAPQRTHPLPSQLRLCCSDAPCVWQISSQIFIASKLTLKHLHSPFLHLFNLFRPSTHWMMSIHTGKVDLFSVYECKC